MLVKGDKIIAKKDVVGVITEGEICEVIDASESDTVSFTFGNGLHKGMMSKSEYEEYFEKYEEQKVAPTVTEEKIKEIIDNSNISVLTAFDKCTIVACQLPNGFVIVESSACVSPENYDVDMGVEICMERITNKIWELEGYRLQDELYANGYNVLTECPYDCDDCDNCPCEEDCDLEDDDEDFDECLDTDLDCDDCSDYDCPFNEKYYNENYYNKYDKNKNEYLN